MQTTPLLLLTLAATLEATGDAIIRTALHTHTSLARAVLILLGAAVLLAYGLTINLPAWDFGRLLGVYVALFFLIAQLINAFAFGRPPTLPILIGGTLILAGALVITLATNPP